MFGIKLLNVWGTCFAVSIYKKKVSVSAKCHCTVFEGYAADHSDHSFLHAASPPLAWLMGTQL